MKMVRGYRCFLILSPVGETVAKAYDELGIRAIFADLGGDPMSEITELKVNEGR